MHRSNAFAVRVIARTRSEQGQLKVRAAVRRLRRIAYKRRFDRHYRSYSRASGDGLRLLYQFLKREKRERMLRRCADLARGYARKGIEGSALVEDAVQAVDNLCMASMSIVCGKRTGTLLGGRISRPGIAGSSLFSRLARRGLLRGRDAIPAPFTCCTRRLFV